jgi:hypothetical protein
MKRFFLLMLVLILVAWAVRSKRAEQERYAPPSQWPAPRHGRHDDARRQFAIEAKRQAQHAFAEAQQAIDEARHEVQKAFHEARDEMRRAWNEANDEMRQANHDARESLAADDNSSATAVLPPPPTVRASSPPRVEADGLPVPIVPGTRVTEAEVRPPAPPTPPPAVILVGQGPPPQVVAPAPPAPSHILKASGLICATEEQAKAEGRHALRAAVLKWLDPEVPGSWVPPARLLDAMVLETEVRSVSKDYGEDGKVYEAQVKFDASPQRRADLVAAYNHDLVEHRLMSLGGALAFVLTCLAAISAYIRADEATKGYYTNRLRMLAAAGVGASGVIIYNMVA